MKKIVIAIPSSHAWFWLQTSIASLCANPPKAEGCEVDIVIIDNSPWSPSILGIKETTLIEPLLKVGVNVEILDNYKSNKFHASGLDCVVAKYDFDYLMAWETDVLALSPNWLEWFVNKMRDSDFAVGHWHHEQFINPSCTLYLGSALREMAKWCKGKDFDISKWHPRDGHPSIEQMHWGAPQDELRWGPNFSKTAPLDSNLHNAENPAAVLQNMKDWICGPFAEKRGWPEGTKLKETPSGQEKGPGWYEPGQALHHWAVNAGYTYTVCSTHTHHKKEGMPVQTLYGAIGDRELNYFEMGADDATGISGRSNRPATAHMWGGTRALDIIKHPVTCEFVKGNTPYWLGREARFWNDVVPASVREATLELIRQHGWHYRGQGSDTVSDRDREAAAFVRECYRGGQVEW